MAFLTIYTPTYQRPTLLQACVASVCVQTVADDIQHLVIRDEVGVGVAGMFAAIPDQVHMMSGRYVYALQDDDVLADNGAVARLREFAAGCGYAEVIICRNRKRGNVYPTDPARLWSNGPQEGHIDLGSYIVRLDIFRRHAGEFGKRYAGDVDFITYLWRQGYRFVFFDYLFAVEQIPDVPGLGRPEMALQQERRGRRVKR